MAGSLCGILALQGSHEKHRDCVLACDVPFREVRRAEDLAGLTHLIIPGGESTTMHKLARQYGLLGPLQEAIAGGLPVMGTCAGAILLGQGPSPPERFNLVPVTVVRNAYGRQRESFRQSLSVSFPGEDFPGVFIRAPKFELTPPVDTELKVLGHFADEPVIVRYRHILLASCHPELTDDLRIHRHFLSW